MQTPEDVHKLVNARKEKVDLIMKKAPEHVLEVIASTVWISHAQFVSVWDIFNYQAGSRNAPEFEINTLKMFMMQK